MGRANIVSTLASRFLLSKNSDGFISLIAWVSVAGVAVGVLALTVVTSVINGFEGELSHVITGMNGDVVLYSNRDPVSEPAAIEAKIHRIVPEARAISHSFITELMAAGSSGVSGAVMEGVDPGTLGQVTVVPSRLVEGTLPVGPNDLVLGQALAERIGATLGSEVRLIIPFGESDANSATNAPQVMKGQVSGIVKMGMYDYDSRWIFLKLETVQDFLNQRGKVTNFKMKLAPDTDTRAISDRLADNFGYPFRAKDWTQLNKNLFYAIKLEKAVISIILAVIVIVAAFNVVSTLMMMIHDKTREIAILKTMGLRPGQGFRLFCLIGMGMGIVGTAIGVGLGLFAGWVIQRTHLIDLPADIYYIGFLPVVVRWREVGLIAVLALAIAFLATLYPAWQVSKRSPLDGLRYE